jgi:DNA-binding response OmpR family regulator
MADSKDKNILVVDDDESVAEFIDFALRNEGFGVKIAHDGNQALNSIKMEKPDLIVLDMMLPGKSGYEIIRSLQNSEYADIPIFVITGKLIDDSFQGTIQFETNVKGYMSKPLKTPIFLHKIHTLLGTMSPAEKKAIEQSKEYWGRFEPENGTNEPK